MGDPFCLGLGRRFRSEKICCVLQTWQRPTLPRLETKYHRRWGVSRPCSEWERVQPPRHNHQVSEAQQLRSWVAFATFSLNTSLIFPSVGMLVAPIQARGRRTAWCAPSAAPLAREDKEIDGAHFNEHEQ